jgi:hypothetical protein
VLLLAAGYWAMQVETELYRWSRVDSDERKL